MDAQGRGQAEGIDPADQWVLNPDTGDYELRLPSSAPQSPVPRPRRAAPAPEREVPAPRRRRTTPEEPPPGRRDRRRPSTKKSAKKKSRAKKILLWTGGTMAFVVLAVGAAGYLYLQHLNDNIDSLPDDGASTGGFRKDQAINILLIGTDKRTGSGNEGYGDKGSAGHADTNILLHVAKDRSNATALSGRTPSCTMRTVTELTGVKPDNFMVADFNAVKTLTSAVGGVEVCLAKDIDDPDSHLNLPAGKHTIEGEDALAFVRTRHSVGFGGDLSRIELQQQFLSSLMRKLKSNDTLTSPTKMVKLAEAGTNALTVDAKLDDIGKLKDLGLELGKLNIKNLTFATVPVKDNPAEKTPVTVVLKEGDAQQVFDMVKNDVSFTEVEQKKKAKQKKEDAAVAARLEGEKSEPAEVRVRILNGGASSGSAGRELTYLQNEAGITKSENAGNAPADIARTTLEYAPDQADQARALAEILGLSGAAMRV
ncbi:LCP family protein, partial [Streptomyces sp. NRRL F-5555]|uniref:LCP family protein n=1 Tax=Streptomyces sp. NRRL F-5555 TaxID=1463863 RepID=UPI0004BEF442